MHIVGIGGLTSQARTPFTEGPADLPTISRLEEAPLRQNVEDEDFIRQQNEDGDLVILSKESLKRAQEEEQAKNHPKESDPNELDKKEQQEVAELRRLDQKVRQHEQAHLAAAGRIPTAGPTYEMSKGPDGKLYATGGHVSFRIPPASSAEEALQIAEQLRRMALAPANPSAKDRSVAAEAAQRIAAARMEMAKERREGNAAFKASPKHAAPLAGKLTEGFSIFA